ncbi:MAG: 3-deoxy-manno-octulosonate cytidylyltransferase [Elusimicrobiota bacterium]
MKIIGVIPARWGSTRFPGKPLADLLGKPLVVRVYEQAKKCRLLAEVIIATDDRRILAAAKSFSALAVLTGKDCLSGTDRIAEVVRNIPADIVVNIQGDEPLINPRAITAAIKPLLADEQVLVSTLACPLNNKEDLDNPNVVKVVLDKKGYALYFSRSVIPYSRDTLDPLRYKKHLGLYVYRKDFLKVITRLPMSPLEKIEKLEQLRILENGYKIKVVFTKYDTIGVDTPEDLIKITGGKKSD